MLETATTPSPIDLDLHSRSLSIFLLKLTDKDLDHPLKWKAVECALELCQRYDAPQAGASILTATIKGFWASNRQAQLDLGSTVVMVLCWTSLYDDLAAAIILLRGCHEYHLFARDRLVPYRCLGCPSKEPYSRQDTLSQTWVIRLTVGFSDADRISAPLGPYADVEEYHTKYWEAVAAIFLKT